MLFFPRFFFPLYWFNRFFVWLFVDIGVFIDVVKLRSAFLNIWNHLLKWKLNSKHLLLFECVYPLKIICDVIALCAAVATPFVEIITIPFDRRSFCIASYRLSVWSCFSNFKHQQIVYRYQLKCHQNDRIVYGISSYCTLTTENHTRVAYCKPISFSIKRNLSTFPQLSSFGIR